MTLIELTVGIALSGIISSALFGAMFVGMRVIDNANTRIAGSNDTQLIASYFASDVASAESVSTTGTLLHSAPSVDAASANSFFVGFWTVKATTTLTKPDSMTAVWQQQGSGLSLEAADEPLVNAGASGDRIVSSALGSSSVNHSVALTPAALATIARSGSSTAAVSSASTLSLPRPATAANGDVLLAHLAVVGGSATSVTAPAGWTLLESKDAGTSVKSLVYQHALANADPSNWAWAITPNRGALGGIVSYSGASTATVPGGRHSTNVSPCGGETPALLLAWTDRGTKLTTTVAYIGATHEGENQLIRQQCLGITGTPTNESVLARNLALNSISAVCSKAPACAPLPISVTLSLAEPPPAHQSVGRAYQLRAATRTTG